jgi:Tol biopolymer transport system component
MAPVIGQTISRYRIEAKIGEGAVGEVYRAVHVDLGHRVAIKILKAELLAGARARALFQREAAIAASLDGPGLCSVIDFGHEDGRTYIVMRYCEGPDLRDVLEQGPLPLAWAVRVAIQLAEAVQVAHRRGIVHRDLKPGNVMVEDGSDPPCRTAASPDDDTVTSDRRTPSSADCCQVRIVDFGLAFLPDSTRVTGTGGIVGTPAYMAPEQVRGDAVDHRADLWAIGVMLHEMVTGRPPFTGESTAAVLDAVRNKRPESLRSVLPGAPHKLHWIVSRLLRKDPEERYADAEELLVDLRDLDEDLRDHAASGGRSSWVVENLRWLRWSAVAVAAVVAVATALWFAGLGPALDDPAPEVRPYQVTDGEAWEGEPALAPDGQRVAYASNVSGQFDIYVVSATGGRPLRLTDDPAHDRAPAWFPGGDRLAFASDRLGTTSVWAIDEYGGEAMLLLADASDPAIDPGGTRLAFVRPDASGHGRIGVAPLEDPTRVRMLTRGPQHGTWSHRQPAWSHDGHWICYGAKSNLWLVELASGEVRPLTYDGCEDRAPAWSPDDRHVYFESLRGNVRALWRVRIADGELVLMTRGGGAECHPSVAPSGRRMAFQAVQDIGSGLLLVDRASGRSVRLGGQHGETFPSLTPDGRTLAFVSDRWGDSSEIWIQDLVGGEPAGEPRRLTDQRGRASHPAISPDGRWVAYYLFNGNARDLWVVPSAGGQPRQLTFDPASDVQPAWSPDGGRIAYASDRGGAFAVWVLTFVDGDVQGKPRRLTPDGLAALRPIWSPDGARIAFQARGEIWWMPADGRGPAAQLTRNAEADRLRWEADTGRIWVCGRWGEGRYSLRILDPASGAPPVAQPFVGPDRTEAGLYFDVSGDGQLVALAWRNAISRIWMLEATEGSF